MCPEVSVDRRLARRLVLDELFDLSLYRAVRPFASGDLARILDELIPIESRHFAFWQEFFDLHVAGLDLGRRVKLALIGALCRAFGAPAIHLALEAIEVYGVRKYLQVWQAYRDGPVGAAVRSVLEDEFKHEDAVVSGEGSRRIRPERIRNIFLGLNDGLVEIVGAVSGFFAAFGNPLTVLAAGATVAVAGAFSMAAGAYIAAGSESEVRRTEADRRRFLGEPAGDDAGDSAFGSALVVGGSYFAGALVPVLPVLIGARTVLPSALAAGSLIVLVSVLLAFLSGMDVRRRVVLNVVITTAAVVVTYLIGLATKVLLGIGV
ncbi:MAG: VIT1/CCC1 transporter family protein [Candidatus Rokubacteria bacterium]|nr:VIT1/CCC1 transporter family protein [Candidatus Rokubacteria bacterium]